MELFGGENGRGAGFASRCDGSAADLLFVSRLAIVAASYVDRIGGHNSLSRVLWKRL